jgi:ABC-type Fe3+ transport system permease subunit
VPLNQCVQMAPTCALAVLDRIASCPWMYRTTVTPPQSRVAVADAAMPARWSIRTVQVKPIWISCLVVGLLLVALIVRYRQRAHLYILAQKRRQERLEAHRFLQEVARALCKNATSAAHSVTVTWFVGLCSRRYWSLRRRRERKRALYHLK